MAFFEYGFITWGIVIVYMAIFSAYGVWIKAVERKEATGKGEE